MKLYVKHNKKLNKSNNVSIPYSNRAVGSYVELEKYKKTVESVSIPYSNNAVGSCSACKAGAKDEGFVSIPYSNNAVGSYIDIVTELRNTSKLTNDVNISIDVGSYIDIVTELRKHISFQSPIAIMQSGHAKGEQLKKEVIAVFQSPIAIMQSGHDELIR